ncbi:trp operon leader peptide [Escherichia coli]|nr:trp operon leader peptide [Escherichia coli]
MKAIFVLKAWWCTS